MMISRISTDRERQTVAIHNRHNFHAFAASRRANFLSATLRRCEARINKALRFVDFSLLAQSVGEIGKHLAQRFLGTPLLEAPMHGLVVRVALRKHVPLRASVEDPQHCFQDSAGWNGLAPRATVRNIFLRKMFANPLPLLIAQFQHASNFTALYAAVKRY